MVCDFSLKHYQECLELALKKRYAFLRFRDYGLKDQHERTIFLRHDVDFQVDVALKMATIEAKLGISSTFFIRLHGIYNPGNIQVYRKIMEIKNLGHELGLHFEPSFSDICGRDLTADIRGSISTMEHLFLCKVESICPHEPSRTGGLVVDKDMLARLNVTYHAYDDCFIKEMKYISDSSCNWREGCMHLFIEKETPRMCILTHPLWWYEESPIENY